MAKSGDWTPNPLIDVPTVHKNDYYKCLMLINVNLPFHVISVGVRTDYLSTRFTVNKSYSFHLSKSDCDQYIKFLLISEAYRHSSHLASAVVAAIFLLCNG